jgi:hypothetical protein
MRSSRPPQLCPPRSGTYEDKEGMTDVVTNQTRACDAPHGTPASCAGDPLTCAPTVVRNHPEHRTRAILGLDGESSPYEGPPP